MSINNSLGLPRAIVNTLSQKPDQHKRRGFSDISVTELIGPPRIKQLKDRYSHLVKHDVVDRIWSITGDAVHELISQNADGLTHLRLFIQRQGTEKNWVISGEVDLVEDGRLWDFKNVKAAAIKDGPKDEWIQQIQIYRLMLDEAKINIAEAKIAAIVRDYSPVERWSNTNYPTQPVVVFTVPLQRKQIVENFVQVRLTEHEKSFPMCTPSERWSRPKEWALYREGGKRAIALYKTEQEAMEQMNNRRIEMPKTNFLVRERMSESLRCKYYCDMWEFCPVGRQERGIEPMAEPD